MARSPSGQPRQLDLGEPGHRGRGELKQHSLQQAQLTAPPSLSKPGPRLSPKLSLLSQASPLFPKCMPISELLKNTDKPQQHNPL